MPMDIRNFFGKKGGGTAPERTKPKAAAPRKRKTLVIDDPAEDVVAEKVSRTSPRRSPRDAVSVDDFCAKGAAAPAAANSTSSKASPRRTSPARSEPSKRQLEEDAVVNIYDDNDKDDPVPTKSSTRKTKAAIYDSDEDYNDDENKGNNNNNTRKPSPKKKAKTDTPVSAKKATPKARTPASSNRRGSSKVPPASQPQRLPLLQPDVSLATLDADTLTPQCLAGYTFCMTGVLSDNVSRDDVTESLKIAGARVTGAVSGKTDYLVCGTVLEDGRPLEEGSKYRRAMENSTGRSTGSTILVHGHEKLYGLMQAYSDRAMAKSAAKTIAPPSRPTAAATKDKATHDTTTATAAVAAPKAVAAQPVNPYAKVVSNPYAKKANTSTSSGSGGGSSLNPYAKKRTDALDRKPSAQTPSVNTNTSKNQLWVDKYKPTTAREILGNTESVRKLSVWLASWEQRFNTAQASKKAYSSPNGPWKAALLSGPPGIGKTTTATLVAQETGRDVLEFNASDVRSKKAMQEQLGDITGSYTLQFRKQNRSGRNEKRTKRVIIMDEVDGMGAGDRSGMAELIQMIKASKVPVICICNDRQSQKMKSLLPYCMDLRYRRPVKSVIAKRAIEVARLEGLAVEQNAAEAIVESCGNDVRQVLNCLQMWSSNKQQGNSLTYKGLKEREHSINKDEILRVSLFDAARSIVEGRKGLAGADPNTERTHFFKRNDAYFVDYNFTGLLVQQNYLKVIAPQFNDIKRQNDAFKLCDTLDRMYDAADSMSDWAMAEHSLRGGMNWSLLPTTAVLAVKTGYHAGGERGGMLAGFPEFTSWLGRNSSRGKKVRLLGELNHHMNYKISSGTSEMRLSFLPVLRERFMNLLSSNDEGSTNQAIELMDDYGLDRDDIFEKLDEFNMDPKAPTFNKFDSKKKAAFTRTYNAGSHKSQALVAEQGGGGKKPKRKAAGVADMRDPDAIDDDAVVEEEEEDEELDAEKIKAMFKKKGRAKPKAKPKAKGKGKKSKA